MKTLKGDELFNHLEISVGFAIPSDIKKILQLTYYNTAITLSKFDNNSMNEIEQFMRDDFDSTMIDDEDQIENYLGL